MLMVQALLLGVSESRVFTARFARDAEFAEGEIFFFSAERVEKKMLSFLVIPKAIVGQLKPSIRTKL